MGIYDGLRIALILLLILIKITRIVRGYIRYIILTFISNKLIKLVNIFLRRDRER